MIYLNNSATSYPKPDSVLDAVSLSLKQVPLSYSRTGIEREPDDAIYACRSKLSRLFQIEDPLNIAFTSSATESLNTAIMGLDLQGAKVITTEIEHNSVLRPLNTLARNQVIVLEIAGRDKYGNISAESIESLITSNTKLIVINHCSNVSGEVLDIAKIAEVAHRNNALILVDASQSAGTLDIKCTDWHIDMLAFTAHKSLYGIQGLGGLYVSPNINLKPLKSGGTGVLSEYPYQPDRMPMKLEAGTPNLPGIIALSAGLDFIESIGIKTIRQHKEKLFLKMKAELSKVPGLKIYNPESHNSYSNFTFGIEGFSPEEINYYLESSFDIIVRSGLHCAPLALQSLKIARDGSVRVSPSYFTSEADIDLFITAIKEIDNLRG